MSASELTGEQREILTAVRRGATFAVRAFAGCGKTSTLRAAAAESTGKRILFLGFNRDVVRETQTVVGTAARAATAPGFVRAALAQRYAVTSDGQAPTLEARVRERLGMRSPRGADDLAEQLAARVLGALTAFCGDAHDVVRERDEEIAGHARAVWESVVADRTINAAEVDVAIKLLYVLQGQQGHPSLGFDVLFFDECQDASAAMLGIMRGQGRAQQVYLGDPAAGLGAQRGAASAFALLDDLAFYSLTTSFRFGPHIAALASRLLEIGGTRVALRVLPRRTDRVVTTHEQCPAPTVVLTRTALQVVDAALVEQTRGRKVAVVGALEPGRLAALSAVAADVYALREGQRPKRFARFPSFQNLKYQAERTGGAQLRVAVALVERFGDRVTDLLANLRGSLVAQDQAEVIVSTAQGFRGRQGARVALAADFRPFASAGQIDRDELHVVYTTVTRAQRVLDLTEAHDVVATSLAEAGASDGLAGILEEQAKLETGITKVPRALQRLVGNAGALHAPEASIRVAVPSRQARSDRALAAATARLAERHRKPVALAAHTQTELAGTFLEALAVSAAAGFAFIDTVGHIGVVPIDGSTLRTANVLHGKQVIARPTASDAAWTLRVTA